MRLSSVVCIALAVVGVASSAVAADPLEALVRERLLTLPPDLSRAKAYPDGAVVSGDLFKSGKRIAIAVASDAGRLLGFAVYLHRDGDWREVLRQPLDGNGQHLSSRDEVPLSFVDLDGDAKPELLLNENGGGDDRVVRVYRFDAESNMLVAAGSGLRNPAWADGAVRGQWKLGATVGDVGAEEHRWVNGRLQLTWRSTQRYAMHDYLIGGGEPAVHVTLDLSDAAGSVTTTSAIGNLASFRNRLPARESPRPLHVLVGEARGRRLVQVTPKADALRAAKRDAQWDDLVSRAVFGDPARFSGDMQVTMGDGTKVALAEVATVTVLPSTLSPVYQFLPISDAVLRVVSEPGRVPALATAHAGTSDLSRVEDATTAWVEAFAANERPLGRQDDVVVFLRLPNISGYPTDQVEAGTLVTGLTMTDRHVQLTVTIDPGQKPSLPAKDVARPLIVTGLGRLTTGTYRVTATITGHPSGPLTVEHAFTVQ
ncbi:MAG: hypothetical protein H0W78_16445 [Planctomycetes bacterium]|nr:hypothetical protein [Planctomycetota bacterium]